MVADESTVTATGLNTIHREGQVRHVQAEKITVKVTPRTGGTPSGKVTVVAGATTVCVIKLTRGKDSCTLGPRKLKPGSYQLTGAYSGARTYARSA